MKLYQLTLKERQFSKLKDVYIIADNPNEACQSFIKLNNDNACGDSEEYYDEEIINIKILASNLEKSLFIANKKDKLCDSINCRE